MSEELRRQIEGRDDVAAISPGVFRESRQADRVYFVEEVAGQQDVVANVFVSSSQLAEAGRHGRGARLPGDGGERRPLPRADERPALRGRARHGGVQDLPVRALRDAHRVEGGQGGARAHHQVDADPGAARRPAAGQPGRAVVADRAADERADPRAARHPALVREPARRALDESRAGAARLHGLQQPAVDLAGVDRAIPHLARDRPVGRARAHARAARS